MNDAFDIHWIGKRTDNVWLVQLHLAFGSWLDFEKCIVIRGKLNWERCFYSLSKRIRFNFRASIIKHRQISTYKRGVGHYNAFRHTQHVQQADAAPLVFKQEFVCCKLILRVVIIFDKLKSFNKYVCMRWLWYMLCSSTNMSKIFTCWFGWERFSRWFATRSYFESYALETLFFLYTDFDHMFQLFQSNYDTLL